MKNWQSRNTTTLAFDYPWKEETYCGSTSNCFSKTSMLHL